MKVKGLIEELQKHDPNLEVIVEELTSGMYDIAHIKTIDDPQIGGRFLFITIINP